MRAGVQTYSASYFPLLKHISGRTADLNLMKKKVQGNWKMPL